MATVQDCVDQINAKIDHFRKVASESYWIGWSIRYAFLILALVIFLAAGVVALLIIFDHGGKFGAQWAADRLQWLQDNCEPLLIILFLIGPAPRDPLPFEAENMRFVVWLVGGFLLLFGFNALGIGAMARAKRLRDQADKDENALEHELPGWKLMENISQQIQNLQNIPNIQLGDIYGGNVQVSPLIQQKQEVLRNILVRGPDEKKPWWTKPAGLIGIGVVTEIIAKHVGG